MNRTQTGTQKLEPKPEPEPIFENLNRTEKNTVHLGSE
jgi:hypothetical protein